VIGGDGGRFGISGAGRHFIGLNPHNFTAVVNEVNNASIHGDGRGDTALGPVEVRVFFAFGHDELPKEVTGLFVEAHEDAAVALFAWVARVAVVGADVDATAGNDRRGMRLSAELGRPFDILPGFGIESGGETGFVGDHIARPGLAPLRLVGGGESYARGQKRYDEEGGN